MLYLLGVLVKSLFTPGYYLVVDRFRNGAPKSFYHSAKLLQRDAA